MAGQYHQFDEHELRQTPGDGEGEGGLACREAAVHGVTVGHEWATE